VLLPVRAEVEEDAGDVAGDGGRGDAGGERRRRPPAPGHDAPERREHDERGEVVEAERVDEDGDGRGERLRARQEGSGNATSFTSQKSP